MQTAIVILNWNTASYLRKFLPGVLHSVGYTDDEISGKAERSGGAKTDVIVADSGSEDNSMQVMEEDFKGVRTIKLGQNLGFTGGYNKSLDLLRAFGYDYYVLMNTDIEVSKGWIEPLVEWMETHPEYGACAPKLLSYYDHDMYEYAGAAGGFIDRFGYPFCRGRVMGKVEKDKGQYDDADVFWATGACLMVRARLFHEMGGLDNRFFAHMEEIDLCWRMQLEGFKIRTITTSVVYHLGGGTLPKSSPWKLFLNFRNNLLMLDNNLSKTLALKHFDNNLLSADSAARKAVRQADRVIFEKMVLDGCSAVVYLLCGKWSYFMSVLRAHSEFRRLRKCKSEAGYPRQHAQRDRHRQSIRKTAAMSTKEYLNTYGQKAVIIGIYPKWMIPKALFGGKSFFEEIRRFSLKIND